MEPKTSDFVGAGLLVVVLLALMVLVAMAALPA